MPLWTALRAHRGTEIYTQNVSIIWVNLHVTAIPSWVFKLSFCERMTGAD
jgi:hypothetical protein